MLSLAKKKKRKRKSKCDNLFKPPHLLCVDDDPDFHNLLAMRMREFDVEFESAYHGMQGITDLVDRLPDLILMDLVMPKGDGEFLLDCIRTNPASRKLPVIVLTGMRDTNQKKRVLAGGADLYLEKPIQFPELLIHLSRFVQIRRRADGGHNQ